MNRCSRARRSLGELPLVDSIADTLKPMAAFYEANTVLNINTGLFHFVKCLTINQVQHYFACIVYANKMLLMIDEIERMFQDLYRDFGLQPDSVTMEPTLSIHALDICDKWWRHIPELG